MRHRARIRMEARVSGVRRGVCAARDFRWSRTNEHDDPGARIRPRMGGSALAHVAVEVVKRKLRRRGKARGLSMGPDLLLRELLELL